MVIDIVLATDMSCHFQQIKNMKLHLNTPERYSFSRTRAVLLFVLDEMAVAEGSAARQDTMKDPCK